MEIFSVPLQILAVIVIVGASVETFIPGILTETFKKGASAITIGLIGIVFSTLVLMIFLRGFNREGFEDKSYLTRWNSMVNANRIPEVCALYMDIYQRMLPIEIGASPEPIKTDAQAREAVDKQFAEVMSTPLLSCSLFEEVQSKKENLDDFYKVIQKVPDIFLVQVYETALACRTLLIRQYLKLKQSENERKEGFEDMSICSDAAAQERKEFKQLSQEAQKCILIEEVPVDQKVNAVVKKLTTIEQKSSQYRAASKEKDSFEKILEDAKYYRDELEKKKQEAEETSNKYNF